MNRIDAYVDDVLSHLPVSEETRGRIEADLRSHLGESLASGLSPDEALARMGPAEEVAAEMMSTLTPAYAPQGRRLGAALLDLSVIMGTSLLLLPLVWGYMMSASSSSGGEISIKFSLWGWGQSIRQVGSVASENLGPTAQNTILIIAAVLFSMLPILYFVLPEWLTGRTPGKLLFGLRVSGYGARPMGLAASVVRRLPMLFAPLFLFDAAAILVTEKRQRASELLARTLVLEAPRKPPVAFAWLTLALVVALVALLWIGLLRSFWTGAF
jgi:uncharacterized RDD family membrane protein YckC